MQHDAPLLERLGSSYLRRGGQAPADALDPVHVLNANERAGMRRVARGAIARAALAGVLNAIATGLGELQAVRLLGPIPEQASFSQQLSYWGFFGGAALLFAVAEVAFLYWDGLRSVRRLAAVAGLRLSEQEDAEVSLALARAALELPNPPQATLGVDPHREASKAQLVLASIVYKLKISLSNFLFKALLRRALGRFATRHVLAFTAIPINAAWNMLVCWSVLREARIRVMGPSAAIEMLEATLESEPEPSLPLVSAIHQAVGSAVVRTTELHPNHAAMLRAVRQRLGQPVAGLKLDDSRGFVEALPKLSQAERCVALRLLVSAAVLDGRLARAERRLLTEAYTAAGVQLDFSQIRRLLRAFVAGDVIERATLRSVALAPAT